MDALRYMDGRVKVCCLIVFMVATFHAGSAPALGLCFAFACVWAVLSRVGWRGALASMRPLAVIVVVTVVAQVAFMRDGAPLAIIGPVVVTSGALAESARMVVRLVALVLASVGFMRCTDPSELAHTFDWVLAPLRAVGLKTAGFSFSLMVAFRFAPVLVSDFRQMKQAHEARLGSFEGSVRARVVAYARLFPPLVRSSFRRADALADASVSRCFGRTGQRTSLRTSHLGLPDAIALAVTAIVAAASFLL